MEITIGKILALLVALTYAVIIVASEGGFTEGAFKGCFVLLFPLALIWFPDEIGSVTGYVGRGGYIDTETPAIFVSIMGWFFLVGLPILLYFLR